MDLPNSSVVVMPLCMANCVEEYLMYMDKITSNMTFQESMYNNMLTILECAKLVKPIGAWITKQNYKFSCQFPKMIPLTGAIYAYAALAVIYKLDYHVKIVSDLFIPSHAQKRFVQESEEHSVTPMALRLEEAEESIHNRSPFFTENTPSPESSSIPVAPDSYVPQNAQRNKQNKSKGKK